ncbi:hypothetical protein [Xenorhabdus nematophila]|nr:hypothetical protein [Xenorhabdus nematophila]
MPFFFLPVGYYLFIFFLPVILAGLAIFSVFSLVGIYSPTNHSYI